MACGSCGTGLRVNAKFCDECGAPTAVSADTAKYKQVTVLFADVVRSMDIAAALDLERLRALLAQARGDDFVYRDLVGRYHAAAESLGLEGHIAWAEAMIEGGPGSVVLG